MKRVILGDCSDQELAEALLLAIHRLGGVRADADACDRDFSDILGSGLHRWRFLQGEVSVFVDAWEMDLAGPEELVEQILAALTAH
ncbi:MAG: hypothetical protein LC104_01935 [Bacteroidales bacterium]|nr:hypothetical protein [Bacteroidales bacterium]